MSSPVRTLLKFEEVLTLFLIQRGELYLVLHIASSIGAYSENRTLIVVKNYTGDALHFGLASEQHRASGAVGDIRVLIVGDDVTVGKTQGGIVGRRGLAGTILVYKIAAAISRNGGSLDEVEAAGKLIAQSIGTVGVGLEHCHVPGTEAGETHLAADEIELGMGIHNEPGFQRLQPLPPLKELVDKMFTMLTSTTDPERSYLPFQGDGTDEVVLMVNNLGAVSELEMGAVAGEAIKWLQERKYRIRRTLVGTYMTSLNMPGFSFTLLLLPRPGSNSPLSASQILNLLDAPAHAPGWKWHSLIEPGIPQSTQSESGSKIGSSQSEPALAPEDPKAFLESISRAAEAVIRAEPEITQQDVIAGDGDAGLTLKAGGVAVLNAIQSGRLQPNNVISAILTIAEIVDEDMGGTSGALYSIFFSGLAKSLRDRSTASPIVNLDMWSKSAAEALATLYKYTRARPPSRTLIDPLTAFVEALPNGLAAGVKAAKDAAEATKHMVAKAGRGAYVDQKRLAEANVPDPGAWGVAVLVSGLAGL
ncbi:Dihydroxyacetone kinase 2 [Tulasnella sp. 419]|nr:Dihydroxyacetone kinase 2 [Tulasnella sp. 419]